MFMDQPDNAMNIFALLLIDKAWREFFCKNALQE